MTDVPGLSLSSAPGRWVLAMAVLGSGMAALDAPVVNIALPVIGREFHTGVAGLQWVMNGCTLSLAAFLLIGGSLGGRFGRRKVYMIGVVWFALASAACGFASSPVVLIITRVLQGTGAALLTPGSLALLEASFAPADRARAVGVWSGLSGVAIAAGPLVGGYLISAASWRWIFFINVPPRRPRPRAASWRPADQLGLARLRASARLRPPGYGRGRHRDRPHRPPAERAIARPVAGNDGRTRGMEDLTP